MKHKTTDKDRIDIVHKYLSGSSMDKIAKEYSINKSSVFSILKTRNIPRRNSSDSHKKYAINENFFDLIDTPEKSYFLGILFADGYNNTKNNLVRICLISKDKPLLNRLRDILGYTKPLAKRVFSNPNWSSQCELSITNKHISRQLEKLGCIPNKSSILEFPTQIPKRLLQHFVRGYYDGDGSLRFYKNNSNQPRLSITSTLPFCNHLQKVIENQVGIKTGIYKHKINDFNHSIQISGRIQIRSFLSWIYKNETISLQRKKELAKRIL